MKSIFQAGSIAAAVLIGSTFAASAEEFSEEGGQDLYRRGFYEEAIAHWVKAADQGDAGAAFRLGEEYHDAKVVGRDIDLAVTYLRQGAEGGDPRAQFDLGNLYDYGIGVEKSREEAAKWFLMAAEAGLPAAQYNIATMYERGEGVEQDRIEAYKYYYLAVQNGFQAFASLRLDELSAVMPPEQIREATEAARAILSAEE